MTRGGIRHSLDKTRLAKRCPPSLEDGDLVAYSIPITSDRSVVWVSCRVACGYWGSRRNNISVAKYVGRQHYHPLTGSKSPMTGLEERQTARF